MKIAKKKPPLMKNKNSIENGAPAFKSQNDAKVLSFKKRAGLFAKRVKAKSASAAKRVAPFIKQRGFFKYAARPRRIPFEGYPICPAGSLRVNACVFVLFFGIGFCVARACHTPTVSVVMPTYNRAGLLERAVDSVLAQTYRDFEFIIVDDGSTDETRNILKSYARKDKRIRVLANETNRGISYARNRGNAAARGKYIMIMDSDDISMPERMERQVDFMEKNPEFAVSTSWRVKIGDEKKKHPSRREMEPHLLFGMYAGHGEWMLRRSFLTANGISYDESRISSEDYDYLRQILTRGGKIGYIDEALYLRRVHRTNSDAYYRAQRANVSETSDTFLRQYGVPEDMIKRRQVCEIFEFAAEANKTKKYLNQAQLNRVVERCRRLSGNKGKAN